MSFEAKDFLTVIFSTAALALSIVSLVRTISLARTEAARSYEQKRFEAVVVIGKIQGETQQTVRNLKALREALPQTLEATPIMEAATHMIQTYESTFDSMLSARRWLEDAPVSSIRSSDLTDIERTLGLVRTQEIDAANLAKLASEFGERVKAMYPNLRVRGSNQLLPRSPAANGDA